MGNDGGVIAVKRKFMRHANVKTRGEQVDQESVRLEQAQTCALSSEPLREPIVACELGNLYNKQALLEHLLARTLPEKFQHITSLKDVVTCHFTPVVQKADETAAAGVYSCPVTMVEFNGKQPFVVVSTCGCVLSERALKEVQSKECLVCGKSMEGARKIALLLSDEQYAAGQKAILARKAEEKRLKKEKKSRKAVALEGEAETAGPKDKKRKREAKASAGSSSQHSSKIVKDAAQAIRQEKEKSSVFASLFTKEKSEQKSANELLMTIGGMRYTLS